MKTHTSLSRKLKPRKYTLIDCIRLPFVYAPAQTIFFIFTNISLSLLPSLTVITTAWFIDTAIAVAGVNMMRSHVVLPLLALLGLYVYKRVILHVKEYVVIIVESKMRLTMRLEIIEKRASLDFKYIENDESNNVTFRIVDMFEKKIMNGFHLILELVELAITTASLLIIFAMQVWWAAIVVAVTVIPMCFIVIKMGKKLYDAEKECSRSDRRANYLGSILSNRETVLERTVFSFTDKIGKKFVEQFEISRKIRLKTDRNRVVGAKTGSMFSLVVLFSVVATLIKPVQTGVVTLGMFIALVNGWRQLTSLLSWGISWHVSELTSTREFLKDLTLFANFSETPDALSLPVPTTIAFESLEFCNVTFSYPSTTKVVLDNLSFRLEAGKHYALVGINGCGKTTITKLITGLYNEFEGDILINEKR